MYSHADANVLKRAIRRSAGWKPLSLFYARTLHLFDRAVFRLTRGRQRAPRRIPVIELTAAEPG